MVAGAGERARCDLQEALGARDRGIGVERLGRHEIDHLGVARRRLQILAHGQEIDIGRTHVVHHLVHLEPFLAQAQHDPGLGEDRRIEPLHHLEQAQRGIIARAGADGRIEPGHGFQIVVVHIGPSRDDRLDRRFVLVAKIGGENLDRGARRGAAQRLDHLDELARSTVSQVVAVDRGDDDMLEPHCSRRIGDMLRFAGIDLARHAGLDVAEGAGAGADIAQDHHRRVLLGPALANIGAGRLFAHGVEIEVAHQLARLVEALAGGRADADPVGLADTGRAALGRLDGRDLVHAARFSAGPSALPLVKAWAQTRSASRKKKGCRDESAG